MRPCAARDRRARDGSRYLQYRARRCRQHHLATTAAGLGRDQWRARHGRGGMARWPRGLDRLRRPARCRSARAGAARHGVPVGQRIQGHRHHGGGEADRRWPARHRCRSRRHLTLADACVVASDRTPASRTHFRRAALRRQRSADARQGPLSHGARCRRLLLRPRSAVYARHEVFLLLLGLHVDRRDDRGALGPALPRLRAPACYRRPGHPG